MPEYSKKCPRNNVQPSGNRGRFKRVSERQKGEGKKKKKGIIMFVTDGFTKQKYSSPILNFR